MKLRSFRVQRNTVLFVAGLSGIAHQTLIATAERPTLIVLFAAMIGLPAFLASDEKKAAAAAPPPPPPPPPPAPAPPPSPSATEAS